jgi:outer membrane murein-binding lipoprotein Lpp
MPTSGTVDLIDQLRSENRRLSTRVANLSSELDAALADISKLRAGLQLAQSQNYCSSCGRGLDSDYIL